MDEKDISGLLSKINDFPTLPTIYSTLLDIMSNPRTTVQDVANVITKDQASSSKILKAVNSSVYGLQGKIDTIAEAIFYIGFNEVKNLVVALSVINIFSNTKSLVNFNMVDFWKHSIAVGVISRYLGSMFGVKNVENYFLAGVVHDIGKLFFLKEFQDVYIEIINFVQENEVPIREAEAKVFGVTHNRLGELLADKWRLPNSIKNSIKYHNHGLIDGRFDMLVACVHLANIIARMMELGNPGDNLVPQPNFTLWKELNLQPKTFEPMYLKIKTDYQQSIGILLLK